LLSATARPTAAGSGELSYKVKKESNPHAHAEKDGNRHELFLSEI
jgi:hypothetical protein